LVVTLFRDFVIKTAFALLYAFVFFKRGEKFGTDFALFFGFFLSLSLHVLMRSHLLLHEESLDGFLICFKGLGKIFTLGRFAYSGEDAFQLFVTVFKSERSVLGYGPAKCFESFGRKFRRGSSFALGEKGGCSE